MTRYIVINNLSGHIWGDTISLDPTNSAYDEPFGACKDIDDEQGISNMVYHEQTVPFAPGEPGYFVFTATDEDGQNIVPPTLSSEDPDQIKLVWKTCPAPFGVWFKEEDE
jgi:hypothetical protein